MEFHTSGITIAEAESTETPIHRRAGSQGEEFRLPAGSGIGGVIIGDEDDVKEMIVGTFFGTEFGNSGFLSGFPTDEEKA